MEKYEYIDAAAEALTEHYANEEIEFVLFEGNAKDQILALQRANYGLVKPDMLGIAHSFQAALDAGATIMEIARTLKGIIIMRVNMHIMCVTTSL